MANKAWASVGAEPSEAYASVMAVVNTLVVISVTASALSLQSLDLFREIVVCRNAFLNEGDGSLLPANFKIIPFIEAGILKNGKLPGKALLIQLKKTDNET